MKNFIKIEMCDAKWGDTSTSQKKVQNAMNEKLGRQVLRYNRQNKISYLHVSHVSQYHSIAMNLNTFQMYSNIFQ